MDQPAIQILSTCRFFQGVTGPSRQRLEQIAITRKFAAGQTVFRQGDPCHGVYIVGSGLVRVFKLAPNGKEHVLHMVPPGGTFAEVAAIGNFPFPAGAQALEETTCCLLPAEEFRQALRADHDLCLGLLASMAGWVKHMVGLVEDMTLRDAVGRVARYLVQTADATSGRVELLTFKRHLASHLNLTSETLSRTLRRLVDDDLIRSDENGIVVLDREGLRELADGLT